MRTPPSFLLATAALAVLLCSCSAPIPPEPDAVEDTVPDTPGGDLSQDLPLEIDDTAPELPDEVAPDAPPDAGVFGDPCDEDGDCASGHCIEVDGALLCTARCDDEACPEETWDCVEVEGGDLICLPPAPCQPTDCETLGAMCGAPDDGCGEDLDCGTCGANADCTETFICVCVYAECGGLCCSEDEVCQTGQCAPPICLPSDTTCDGVDDDCDGDTDEDYQPDASCGVGACLANNLPSECINGIEVPCTPGQAALDDGGCDGSDNDCDGTTDEDYVPDAACGTGWCKDSNTSSSCADGVETPCVPGEALDNDTTCDGIDDDCDGFIDDNFVPDDDCGVGACALDTTPSTCVGGVETSCVPGEPLADMDLTCNGIDEDCDGVVDEDYIFDATCGTGWCLDHNTASTCVGGVETACIPGEPLGVDSTCDGIDDDCDGAADEDYESSAACGVGICQVTATPSSCVNGVETPCVPGVPLGDDTTCDGVDDDCDGSADEDAVPPCVFGEPVSGLPLTFEAIPGIPGGVVIEGDEGNYYGTVVDLDAPSTGGSVTAVVGNDTSSAVSYTVVAGDPKNIHLVTSRGTVTEDAPATYVVAEVTDEYGAPVSDDTEVIFDLEGFDGFAASTGEILGGGRFAAWIEVSAAAFDGGDAGTVTVSAGLAAATAPLVATAAPEPLALDAGEVALLLPLGPALVGGTFEVPVVVDTGDDDLGLYDVTVVFDNDLIQLVAVAVGAAPNLTPPEAGSLVTANAVGEISFNGISVDPLTGGAQGEAVEIAVLYFMVAADLDEEAVAVLSGTVNELANTLLTDIRTGSEMIVRDAGGPGSTGVVSVRAPALRGIFVRATDPVMLQDGMITGAPTAAPLEIIGLSEDHTLAPVAAAEVFCLSLAPGVLDAGGCLATAVGAGTATVQAEAAEVTASTQVRVAAPELPLSVTVGDSNLQYITDLDQIQGTRVRVLATFEDGAGLAWTLDVTDSVEFVASGPIQVDADGAVIATENGPATVTAVGALGENLGTVDLAVNGMDEVSIVDLHVMIPAHMDPAPVGEVTLDTADAVVSVQVTDLFTGDGQQAGVFVVAVFSDDEETDSGSRLDVTAHPDLSLSSTDPAVGTVEGCVVTAVGSGDAAVEAALDTEAGGTITGTAPLRVQLPPPAGVDVSAPSSKIAMGPTDLSATVLGLPTKLQIQVVVHFQDGTSLNYTDDPSTVYTVTDPILQVFGQGDCPTCPPGQVSASGVGSGLASVQVTFDDPYLASLSDTVDFEVVTHDSLAIYAWEPWTPAGEEAAPEAVLSFIEGTAARQKARLEAAETFTDGSTVDVSTDPALTWEVRAPGTSDPLPGVIDVVDAVAYGVGGGSAEVVGILAGHESGPLPLAVDMADEDLVALSVEYPAGTTVQGIKDQGIAQLQVTGTFGDGTHDILTGDDLIPGLLVFNQDKPAFATTDATGLVTVHGNGPVVFAVFLSADVDTGASIGGPGVRLLPVNLSPDMGDVDLGEETGLAHPDRDADAVFEMPVRVNTGGEELGGVDLEITYDPLVLEVLDVVAGADIPGAMFSVNPSIPGIVYLNASPVPDGAAVSADLEVAVLTFKALKGGPQVTEIGGTIVDVIDVDNATIGPDTPRPIVAGAGDLDPPPIEVFGDANDDGEFTVGDVLFIRKIKASSVVPDETQLAQSDVFPDGEVKVSDAYFASQSLARLTHFVELTATPVAGGHLLQATLTDRDQEPVDDGVLVRFEASVSDNLGTVTFTLPHAATDSGVVTEGVSAGGGVWETTMTGVDIPEQIGLVVIVDVLDPWDAVIWTTPFLSTPLVDPNASFTPLLLVGECVAACAGAVCGDADGCGGLCDGTCPVDEVCQDGACVSQGCVPLTCEEAGVDCGITLDGCGWILDCGGCGDGESCLGGVCIPDGCEPDCAPALCGEDDGCGGVCFGPCPFSAQVCVDGVCECMGADCDGKLCGEPDGCGDVCQGSCPGENDECVDGVCVCGGTICGDDCCGQDELCEGGICVPACTPKLCGDPGAECGQAPDGCGGTLDCGEACGINEWCTPDFICDCLVVECEGVCCDPLEQCIDGVCAICEPDCAGKFCGDDDGCDGICLACPGENEICANGECVCIADCDGKLCGEDDGCGSLCDGSCTDQNAVCQDGACVCKFVECAGVCCTFGETCQGGVCM